MTGGQYPFQVVSFQQIIAQVMDTLELPIQQNKAIIEIGALPAIMGDELQLNQLFQKLLSNALKFSKSRQSPQIHISAQMKERWELPAALKPLSKSTRFHQISVTDQGIGFDEQFLDPIFEVSSVCITSRNSVGRALVCQFVSESWKII